ncbi:hypothetical protein VN97_g11090 [Penicillium thymicola]|uniref:Uncharacterized protein n=1 Tax=Penicillium thymicola TaxID=293382 RepID=A0AAI9T802_PENTH|nr:hypothetical protein VN97_g11090 [Penicillium thymicola]
MDGSVDEEEKASGADRQFQASARAHRYARVNRTYKTPHRSSPPDLAWPSRNNPLIPAQMYISFLFFLFSSLFCILRILRTPRTSSTYAFSFKTGFPPVR